MEKTIVLLGREGMQMMPAGGVFAIYFLPLFNTSNQHLCATFSFMMCAMRLKAGLRSTCKF